MTRRSDEHGDPRNRPPRWARRLLELALPREIRDGVTGDVHELFLRRVSLHGLVRARLWYLGQVLSFALRFGWARVRRAGRRRGETRAGISTYLVDLRHSARSVFRRPGFAAVTVGTLAVGIGATTSIFSLAEAMLFRPLDVEAGDRLVRVFSVNPTRGLGRFSVSQPDYSDFTARRDLFETSSFYSLGSADVSGEGVPERVSTAAVHREFFQTLETSSVIGRRFESTDHEAGSPATAVVSRSFWMRRFGGAAGALGRTIRLDGVPHTVVGVVPDEAAWPAGVQVWIPLQWGSVVPDFASERSNHAWQMIARLRPGVEVTAASGQIEEMADAIYAREGIDPRDEGTSAIVVALHSSEAGEGAGALFATLGTAVFLVLLLACMNASGLLLIRSTARARELSLRAALGAGRTRLAWILFGECAALAVVGGGLGLVLGHFGLRRALRLAPPEIANLADLRLNAHVVLGALGITLFATLIAGVLPASRASRVPLARILKEGGSRAGGPGGSSRLRRAMVIAELALSLTLLVSAGLAVRGVQRQLASDPGFEPSGVLSFSVRLPETRYVDDPLVDDYFREAVDRLEALPGVRNASVTSRLPLGAGGVSLGRSFIFDGAVPPPGGPEFGAAWVEIDPGYLETLGIRATEGRALGEQDRADAPLVAMVNERMAGFMSPNEPIVGRVIRSVYDENLPRTVIGVVPDLQLNGVSRAERIPAVFVPRAQSVRTSMAFLVRTAGLPSDAIPGVRATLTELDPDVALERIQPLRAAHAADLGGIRFLTVLFGAFGGFALVLAVSGVYGVIAYSISQRTKEFGIRVAVGARPATLSWSVIRESAVSSGVGLAIGGVAAYGVGRVLESGMSGVARLEASTFLGVGLLLGVAVLVASWIPAARAARVDPMAALRED